MRKLFLAPLAALLLTVGSCEPAFAHQASQTSFFYCASKRIQNGLILHSVPTYLDTHYVIYACKEGPVGSSPSYTFNVWVSLDDGSSVGTHYQSCDLGCQNVP